MVSTEEYCDMVIVYGGLHRNETRMGDVGYCGAIMGVGNIIMVIKVMMVGYGNIAMVMHVPPKRGKAFVQSGIADGTWSHINPTASLA
jgi:hypothetical protein